MPTYTVTATCNGESATALVTVPAPALALDLASQGLDVTATVTGAVSDSTVTVDWGDGTPAGTAPADAAGKATATHPYAKDGTYTVTASGPDRTDATEQVTVARETSKPTVTTSAVYLTATAKATTVDPSDTTVTIDWGQGSPDKGVPVSGGTVTKTHTYTADGTYTVKVTGDVTGNSGSKPVTVTALAAAADVSRDPQATATVTNVDASDTTVAIDWGDGSSKDTGVPVTGGTGAKDHAYATNDTFTITVTGEQSGQTASTTATIAKAGT